MTLTINFDTLTGDASDVLAAVAADLTDLPDLAAAPLIYEDNWLAAPVNVIWARDGQVLGTTLGTFAPKTWERQAAYKAISIGSAVLDADTVCAVCDSWITTDATVAAARIDADPGVTLNDLATEPGQVREAITVCLARIDGSITYASAEYTGQPGSVQFATVERDDGTSDGDMPDALRAGLGQTMPPPPDGITPVAALCTLLELIDWPVILRREFLQ